MSGPSGTGGSGGGGLGGGSGLGGSGLGGGSASGGGSGGGGGEDIGVAQEADLVCCCTSPPDGQQMYCSWQASCPPYTGILDGACGPPPSSGGCSTFGVCSGAGGAAEVLVLLLALAALRAVRRRFV